MNLYQAGLIIRTAISDYRPRRVFALFSGGHDSLVATHVAMRHPDVDGVLHVNTGTGIPETFQFVQETCARQGWPLTVLRPRLDELTSEPGAQYRKMVLAHGFPGPGRIPHRITYVELKEKTLSTFVTSMKRNSHDRIMLIGGVRRQESAYRMGHAETIHRQGAKVWVNPLIDWTADDCGAYIEAHGLRRNLVSDLLHISGECLCGCFAKPGEREDIAAWFPLVDARIRALETEAAAAGVPARWGKRPGKYYLQTRRGQLDMFLCASCMKADMEAETSA